MKNGVPDAGDVVRLRIGPSSGNEQDGYRAVLVISDLMMNEITKRFTGLPITSTIRGWETEVPIESLQRPGTSRRRPGRSDSNVELCSSRTHLQRRDRLRR